MNAHDRPAGQRHTEPNGTSVAAPRCYAAGVVRHSVLLVDDDQYVIHGLTRALRRQPYRIFTARSADEATGILESHDVDVIVADEKMPEASGSELVAWVAERYPEVVRIVLSGHAPAETSIRSINEGAVFRFLTKPCRDLSLAIAIRKALEHRDLLKENHRLRKLREENAETPRPVDRDLDALTRAVSNDLRPPLCVLAELCQGSVESGWPARDPRAMRLLDDALHATSKIARLAGNLLAQSLAHGPIDFGKRGQNCFPPACGGGEE